MGYRTILHSDLNCFYASVEMMLNPKLRGKAVAVCGSTENRHGIVLAKSELAKKAGIKTGMVNWEARQACPNLISLAINLAFSCSLRLGEMVGLTWDCVDISEQSINDSNASLYVEKELTRVTRDALQKLENRDVLKVFPAVFSSNSTALVLKRPKTQTSVRRIWLPKTVAEMLVRWKAQQEEMKEYLGSEYLDFGMVIAQPNGRPLEGQIISRAFSELIRANELPNVVFHSLRHTSTTYKLKLNKGDMKAVQGDTGHAQLKMVSDVYSHILDEDRKNNAAKFEEAFYQKNDPSKLTDNDSPLAAVLPFEAPQKKEPTADSSDASKLIELLKNSPELAAELLRMVSQSNGSTLASVSSN